jgi:hypothetical protein
MDATVAALLGAVIGGLLSVFASWLAQRVQSRSQLVSQEIQRRQVLYSEFVQATVRCYADALQENEPDPGRLANIYGEIGRMRLYSSDAVLKEANRIAHAILEAYSGSNRTKAEIRDFLASDSVDLFSDFGDACRAELAHIQMRGVAYGPSMFRLTPMKEMMQEMSPAPQAVTGKRTKAGARQPAS